MLRWRIHVCLFLCFDFIPLHTVIICEEGRDDCPSHTAYVRRSCNLGLRRLLCSRRGILWAEQLRSLGVSLLNTVLCSTFCERGMDGDDIYIQNLRHPRRHQFLKGILSWADGHFSLHLECLRSNLHWLMSPIIFFCPAHWSRDIYGQGHFSTWKKHCFHTFLILFFPGKTIHASLSGL